MTRSLILLGAAIAAVAWLVHQPAYAHDTPHKQAVALILLDIILSVRKKRRGRARSPQPQAASRAKAGAGRW